jgi:hypothetical protein
MNVTKDKAKSPDKPVLENEKTLFSSGTPAFYADRNQDGSENKASKMKETIGKASKNLHSTLQNAKEKVVNILSSKLDGHTGENETPSHNNKNETLNNDSNETSYPSATKNLFAAKEFIDEEIGKQDGQFKKGFDYTFIFSGQVFRSHLLRPTPPLPQLTTTKLQRNLI